MINPSPVCTLQVKSRALAAVPCTAIARSRERSSAAVSSAVEWREERQPAPHPEERSDEGPVRRRGGKLFLLGAQGSFASLRMTKYLRSDLSPQLTMSRFVILGAFIATSALAQSPTLTPYQKLAREVYSELISINTVDSVGSVTKAVVALALRFRAAGFPESDIKILTPAGKPTKGNFVVRYRGRGGPGAAKPILLLAHLDVVAALRSDWPRDPFTLYEENGFFLGRGTSDDKAMASIFVANMLGGKQEGWKPSRDIILALTADEESGDANGPEWLVKDHRADIDAAFAINEGGGGTLSGSGMNVKPLFHSIQAAEKVYVDYTLTAINPSCNSSVPRPDNAIYELSDALG